MTTPSSIRSCFRVGMLLVVHMCLLVVSSVCASSSQLHASQGIDQRHTRSLPIPVRTDSSLTSQYCSLTGRRKVLVIGLDGTKGNVFWYGLQQGMLPNFKSLTADGRGLVAPCQDTADVRCATAHSGHRYGSVFPQQYNESDYIWVTSPGWASVVTGVDNSKTHVQSNVWDDQKNMVLATDKYPTFFRRAQELGLRTAASGAPNFLSSADARQPDAQNWGIVDFECGNMDMNVTWGPVDPAATSSCNLNYRAGQMWNDEGRDEKTTEFGVFHISDATDCADVIMTHYDLIDDTGHSCNFSINPCYLKAMTVADGQIGRMITAIQNRVTQFQEEWLVMVTADHGGHERGHDVVNGDDEVVPFILATFGPNPIPLRPLTYPVKHYDVHPTVMYWLGVNDKLWELDGSVQGLPLEGVGEMAGDVSDDRRHVVEVMDRKWRRKKAKMMRSTQRHSTAHTPQSNTKASSSKPQKACLKQKD